MAITRPRINREGVILLGVCIHVYHVMVYLSSQISWPVNVRGWRHILVCEIWAV